MQDIRLQIQQWLDGSKDVDVVLRGFLVQTGGLPSYCFDVSGVALQMLRGCGCREKPRPTGPCLQKIRYVLIQVNLPHVHCNREPPSNEEVE